jgi:hypothetical protein
MLNFEIVIENMINKRIAYLILDLYYNRLNSRVLNL